MDKNRFFSKFRGELYLVTALFLGLFLLACERQQREQAGTKGAPIGDPKYTVSSHDVSAANISYVAEVMPKANGGALDGEALFVANCSACHQVTGKGVPGAFPPLDGSPYVLNNNVERMASIMLYGLQGPINVLGTTYTSVMAPLGKTLSNEELSAIAGYVRTAWSNKASGIEPTVFEKMRQKWGERTMFSISELGEEK